MISFYLQEPATAIVTSLLLVYNPPLLDILPMYVVFMIGSPLLLAIGLRWSWTPILIGSLILWLGAQFGMAREIFEAARDVTGLKVPYHETGAFDLLAWQLIWLIGLWLGAQVAAGREIHFVYWIVWAAVVVAAVGFSARYGLGQAPFPEHKTIALLLDKWRLGPFRLLNFLALLIVMIHFAPALKSIIRWRPLERLGAASLPVFCSHLVSVLVVLALVGDKQGSTSLPVELALLAATFSVMFAASTKFRLRAKSKNDPAPPDREIAVSARGGR